MWCLKKIPKIAHFYWGNNGLSFLRYLTIYSFRKENPDWEIRIYKPETNFQGEKTWTTMERYQIYSGENYFERVEQLADKVLNINFSDIGFLDNVPETYKADFLRWKLLSEVGGLWSDFDIIYIKPMNNLYFNIETNNGVDTIICYSSGFHRIGFLLSNRNNRFFKYIAAQVPHCFNKANYQSIGSYILNTSFPNIGYINKQFSELNLLNMKMNAVYPINENSVSILFQNSNFKLNIDSIGIHWFGGHPQSGNWERLLTANNFINYQNILCEIIKGVLSE